MINLKSIGLSEWQSISRKRPIRKCLTPKMRLPLRRYLPYFLYFPYFRYFRYSQYYCRYFLYFRELWCHYLMNRL